LAISDKKECKTAVMELAMQAGHILLENGAEIFRVEETMNRICKYYEIESESSFVLTNGIFITSGNVHEDFFAKVQQIPVSGSRLDIVDAVNQLSREIEQGMYTVEEAAAELERIRKMPDKKKPVIILASGIASAAFCYLFGGNPIDSFASFLSGLILYVYVVFLADPHLSKIVGKIGGGLTVALTCGLLHALGIGQHLNFMMIGSIMPLVPGVAFTNAIRDMTDENYLSGSVRLLDALLSFLCIALGVGIGISILGQINGNILPYTT